MSTQSDIQQSATVLPFIREPMIWHPVIVAGGLRQITRELFDPYHPERHYMRGPGPRWHEKHAPDSIAVRPKRGPFVLHAIMLFLVLLSGGASSSFALAQEAAPLNMNGPNVEVVVTACPVIETPLEPINQGKVYDDERSLTRAERVAFFRASGCIDVPIPPEYVMQELSYQQCMGHAGYLAAMQYLEQNKTLVRTPVVGQWACIPGGTPFVGVAYQ